jgi:hypothetical protein
VNNNIRKRSLSKQTFVIGIIIFLATVCLSGCTDTKNTDNSLNNFIGTWAGSVNVPTFGSPRGGNSTFTVFTFMQDIVLLLFQSSEGSI